MEFWGDTELVYEFLEANSIDLKEGVTIFETIDLIQDESMLINDKIVEIAEKGSNNLDAFFRPLNDHEIQIVELSPSKAKANVNHGRYLRLYAIRIDANMYLVTGGAIKLTHKMQDRPHTQNELDKLKTVKSYLKSKGVFDDDSFHEFLNE